EALVDVGKALAEQARHARQIGPGLRKGDAWAEPSDGAELHAVAILLGRPHQRNEDIAGVEERRAFRQHADDERRLAVERHGLADDARLRAEARLPESAREHDDCVVVTGLVFAGHEKAPGNGRATAPPPGPARD